MREGFAARHEAESEPHARRNDDQAGVAMGEIEDVTEHIGSWRADRGKRRAKNQARVRRRRGPAHRPLPRLDVAGACAEPPAHSSPLERAVRPAQPRRYRARPVRAPLTAWRLTMVFRLSQRSLVGLHKATKRLSDGRVAIYAYAFRGGDMVAR